MRAEVAREGIARVRGVLLLRETAKQARERPGRAFMPQQMSVRVAIGFQLEFARIARVQHGGGYCGGKKRHSGRVAGDGGDQYGDARFLEHEPHRMLVTEVTELVRKRSE